MFPGAGAHVYTSEEGEPLGWDYDDGQTDVTDPLDADWDGFDYDDED